MVDVELEGRVRALLDAQASGKSGALEVQAPEGVTIVYFHAGKAVFAEEGTLGETLGRLLVAQGRLTQEQYARVIDHMTERIVHNEAMRFGEAVIELGMLTPDQVHEALADQVKRKIGRALRWEHATATFRESDEILEGLARFPCTVEPVVLSVCREHIDHDRLNAILSTSLAKHWIAPPAAAVSERFGATAAEMRIVRSLDGSQTLVDCIRTHGDAALPILAALVLTGALEAPRMRATPEPTAPVARARKDTPTTRIPPQMPAAMQVRDDEREAEARRRATAAAASLWLGRHAASSPDPKRARIEGEQAFQRGRRLVREGQLQRADAELRRAVELFPEADEYRLYVAFVELRLAADDTARAKLAPAIAKRVREVLKRDSGFAFAHYVDAHLALAEGDVTRAERCFRTTLRLDPTEIDAERQLRLLVSRNPKPKR